MDRRWFGVGVGVLLASFILMAGSASARGPAATAAGVTPGTCTIKSQPSFVLQGEYELTATAADVIEVGCDPTVYGTDSKVTVTASQLYSRCADEIHWYVPNNEYNESSSSTGLSVGLTLDADGNGTVALIAGPHCMAGESLISVHETEEPWETATTSFSLLPPTETPVGLTAIPATQIEDSSSSAFATIIQAEFSGASEKEVRVGSEELYARCRSYPHLQWISEGNRISSGVSEVGSSGNAIHLDNDGNGFVLVLGDSSCASGVSLIEGDLLQKPFTTLTTTFTVEAPKPRV